MTAERALRYGVVLYMAGWVVHAGDHFRKGYDHSPVGVRWAGNIGLAVALVILVLVLRGHWLSPLLGVVYGFGTAIVLSSIHFAPHWGFLSEPYRGGTSPFSWFAIVFAVATAFLFGVSGVYALRRERLRIPPPGRRLSWSR